jgi:hypothetical protein
VWRWECGGGSVEEEVRMRRKRGWGGREDESYFCEEFADFCAVLRGTRGYSCNTQHNIREIQAGRFC